MSKLGRNDPCHCGSGKKYKKCCLEADAHVTTGNTNLVELVKSMDWANYLYKNIALLIINSMKEHYRSEYVLQAITLWHHYSSDATPIVRKPKVICATIEYVVSEVHGFGVTQAELASRYDVSTAAISKRLQDIIAFSDSEEFMTTEEWSEDWQDAEDLDLEPDWDDYDEDDAFAQLTATLPALKKKLDKEQRKLDKQLFIQDKGFFWLNHKTRPYMLAKYQYAQTLWVSGQVADAEKQLNEIIELNNMDNLGARYLLLPSYLELRQLEQAEQLLKTYQDDASASFAYDRIILEYLKNGTNSTLKLVLRSARKQNPHVLDYLFNKKTMPADLPEFIGIGDENEAIDYVAFHSRLWVQFPELLQWMTEQAV